MKLRVKLIVLMSFFFHAVTAQTYTVDYTFEYTYNSRIILNGKFGLIDSNNKLLIPATYDKVNDFHSGFAKVVKEGKVGFVNRKAEEVIPCMYEQDTLMITGAIIERVIENGSNGIERMDLTIDERREGFNENLVCVIKNGKYGFIDKTNNIVIPFQYDGADNFYNGIAVIREKDKYGAIDKSGKIVIPVVYDLLVWDFTGESVLYAQQDSKSFLLDKTGKRL